MRDSISLILYANYLGLSAVISAKVHSLNVHRSLKSRKKNKTPQFSILWSFKVIDVGIPGRVVNSACKQQVCVYLQPFYALNLLKLSSGILSVSAFLLRIGLE